MNYWVLIYRFAWFLLVVLCIIGLTCIFLPKCQNYKDLQAKKARMEQETRDVEAAIRDLQQQQEKLERDGAFVERTARELGMAKAGETIFKFAREPVVYSATNRGKTK